MGEQQTVARLLAIWIQSLPELTNQEMPALLAWLEGIAELNPDSSYPLFLAGRVLGFGNTTQQKQLYGFVERRFRQNPEKFWSELAYVAVNARHGLNDMVLAQKYAHALVRNTPPNVLPPWARQLEALLLTDMGHLQQAQMLVGAMINDGLVTDPAEIKYLNEWLIWLQENDNNNQ
ncbi:MAG: hypothetical protein HQL54_08400 [Magnetococcales bacterium]|nr:hypothetical protein [Magnetococcales bacterium]